MTQNQSQQDKVFTPIKMTVRMALMLPVIFTVLLSLLTPAVACRADVLVTPAQTPTQTPSQPASRLDTRYLDTPSYSYLDDHYLDTSCIPHEQSLGQLPDIPSQHLTQTPSAQAKGTMLAWAMRSMRSIGSMRSMGYAYAQNAPSSAPRTQPPRGSAVTELAITSSIFVGLGLMGLVVVGIFVGRSLYVIKRDIQHLHHALTQTQQQRHELAATLADQTRHIHAWQQALAHVADGVYRFDKRFDKQGMLLEVITSHTQKSTDAQTAEIHTQNTLEQPLETIFPHKLAVEVRRLLEQTLESGESQQTHYSEQTPNGHTTTTKHYQLHCLAIDDNEGLLIVRDLSEHTALQQSEQRSKAILAALPDALGRFSRSGYYLEVINQEVINQGRFEQV